MKFCITFAGAVGSSKTPVATYLSCNLDLPILNNDAIRSEVTEDLLRFDQEEYVTRRDARLRKIIQSEQPFIFDASVDREWPKLRSWLEEDDYQAFIISLDLSKPLLTKLLTAKDYDETLARIDTLMKDHQNFLETFAADINLHISDAEFPERLELSLASLKEYLP